MSALTALSGNISYGPVLSAVNLNNLAWNDPAGTGTYRDTYIYSATDSENIYFPQIPLSYYGVPTLTALGDATLMTYINGYVEHHFNIWVQKNNETYGGRPLCYSINRLDEPAGGSQWASKRTFYNVYKGNVYKFYIGAGPHYSFYLNYFYNYMTVQIASTPATSWITLSAPVHFSNYVGQDYDMSVNPQKFSEYKAAMNYDPVSVLNDRSPVTFVYNSSVGRYIPTITSSTQRALTSNAYYYYSADNSIRPYLNPIYPLSSLKIKTRHIDGSDGTYVSYNATLSTNFGTGNNILYRINKETYNSLPLCRILPLSEVSMRSIFSNLSSYADFYVDVANPNQNLVFYVGNNYSSLHFYLSNL
jgi:hypothetical protein